jgi:hypothetical protein
MDRSIGNPERRVSIAPTLPEALRYPLVPPVLGNPDTGDHPCAEVDQWDVSAIGSKCANNEYEVSGGNKHEMFRLV